MQSIKTGIYINNYGKQSFHLETKVRLTVVHPYLKNSKVQI